jgi:DNA-binding HxlR family transcriptional regulator
MEAALAELAARRLIERRQVETAGRPRTEYRLIAPQMTLFQ